MTTTCAGESWAEVVKRGRRGRHNQQEAIRVRARMEQGKALLKRRKREVQGREEGPSAKRKKEAKDQAQSHRSQGNHKPETMSSERGKPAEDTTRGLENRQQTSVRKPTKNLFGTDLKTESIGQPQIQRHHLGPRPGILPPPPPSMAPIIAPRPSPTNAIPSPLISRPTSHTGLETSGGSGRQQQRKSRWGPRINNPVALPISSKLPSHSLDLLKNNHPSPSVDKAPPKITTCESHLINNGPYFLIDHRVNVPSEGRNRDQKPSPRNSNEQPQTPPLSTNKRWQRDEDEDDRGKVILLQDLSDEDRNVALENANNCESPLQYFIRQSDLCGNIEIEGSCLVFQSKKQVDLTCRNKLKRLFKQHSKAGFLPWLGGEKGWRYEEVGREPDRFSWTKDFVLVLNSLQDVHKMFADDEQLYIPDTNRELIWKKQNSLKNCVADVRFWLETLPRNSRTVDALLVNSNEGPEAPVHWSHHHPKSQRYALTLVTRKSMQALINGIVKLFRREFKPQGHKGPFKLGTLWFEAQQKKSWSGWRVKTSCLEWNKRKLHALLDGEETFTF